MSMSASPSYASSAVTEKREYLFPPGDFDDTRTIKGTLNGKFGIATCQLSRRCMTFDDENVPEDLKAPDAGYEHHAYDFDNSQGAIALPSNDERWYRLGGTNVVRMNFKSTFQPVSRPDTGVELTNERYTLQDTKDGELRVSHTDRAYLPPARHEPKESRTHAATCICLAKERSIPGKKKSISYIVDRVLDYPDFDVPICFRSQEGAHSVATYTKKTEAATMPRGLQKSTVGAPPFIGIVHPPRDGETFSRPEPAENCSTVYCLPHENVRLAWTVKAFEPVNSGGIPPLDGFQRVVTEDRPWGIETRFTYHSGESPPSVVVDNVQQTCRPLGISGVSSSFSEGDIKPKVKPRKEGTVFQGWLDHHFQKEAREAERVRAYNR